MVRKRSKAKQAAAAWAKSEGCWILSPGVLRLTYLPNIPAAGELSSAIATREGSHGTLVAMAPWAAPECREGAAVHALPRVSQVRVPQTPKERLAALYRQLALTTSHHDLLNLRRSAEQLAAGRSAVATEARAFIEACRMKAAELQSPPAAEKRRNPSSPGGPAAIKMHITRWVEDEHGIMGREVYAIDE
jgi:hypothetical protein